MVLQQGVGKLEGLELTFIPTAVRECVGKRAPDTVVAQLSAGYK